MKAPARLGLYGLVLVTVFAAAAFAANALVSTSFVETWVAEAPEGHGGHDDDQNDDHSDHDAGTDPLGLGLEQDGYRLIDIDAPTEAETEGTLSFAIGGPDGERVNDFDLDHEEEMHLIVVRSDGQHFRHVHPDRDTDGTWSIPWAWDAAGAYRVFADFVPTASGDGLTLSTQVQVSGAYDPLTASGPVTEAHVGDFHVTVEGDLAAGESSELTMVITRDGDPVTTLEPYLGAFGHLVALRDGDLAYLHVHPQGDAPGPGETSGPEIVFEATAPTPGAYLLFLDFRVDGEVYTAPLVLEAGTGAPSEPADPDSDTDDGNDEEEEDHDH